MQSLKEIYNTIKSKSTRRTIISMALVCTLIFPAVLVENYELPRSNENLFFLGCKSSPVQSSKNISDNYSWQYILLNHRVQPVANTSVYIRACAEWCFTDPNGILTHEPLLISTKTNGFGGLNISSAYLISVVQSFMGIKPHEIIDFILINYSIPKSALEGTAAPKYSSVDLSCTDIHDGGGNETRIYFGKIPSRLVGYYGLSPIFIECGNLNTTFPVNISYKLYNPQNPGKNYTAINLTVLHNRQIYTVNNYSLLKEFNEADNVTFYLGGQNKFGSLFSPFSELPSGISRITFTSSFGLLITNMTFLIALGMVLIIYTPMFNINIHRRYLNLPEKRTKTILVQLSSSLIFSASFSGIALGASFITAFFILHITLSPLAILFTFATIEGAIFVLSSIYTLIFSYFPGRYNIRNSLTIYLGFIYFMIPLLGSTQINAQRFTSKYTTINLFFLFKPVLDNIRTYNIVTSLIPLLSVENLNDYLLRIPFPGVVMYNHLNLFDLTPILLIPAILGFSALFIYLGIRKFNKI